MPNGVLLYRPYTFTDNLNAITMSFWVYNHSQASFGIIDNLTVSGNNRFGIFSGGNNEIYADAIMSNGFDRTRDNSGSILSQLVWTNIIITLNFGDDRAYLYFNARQTGGFDVTGVVSKANNFVNIVVSPRNATQIAECAIWRGAAALNATERAKLAAGVNPLDVRENDLQDYWPLRSSLRNLGRSGVGLLLANSTDAVFSFHPPIAPPRRRPLIKSGVVAPLFKRRRVIFS